MPRPVLRAILLAALCALPLAVALADEEIVKEFRRYFRRFKDTASRVEAVMSLEGTESAAVVDALVPVLGDPEREVADAAVRVLASFKTPPPVAEIYARLEKEKSELARSGLLRAIADGGHEGPLQALAACVADRSWEVRRRALQAIAARGGEGAAEATLRLVGDSEPAVRSAALEGLAKLRSPAAVDAGIAALEDAVWQVRASAAHALATVRDKRSIGPLIARMEREEGRLVADYAAALEELTARRFGQRVELWRRFWDDNAERYQIPTDEELAKLRQRQAEAQALYKPPGAVTYHGIDTPSRSIVFVIDVSGSMETLVVERERFQDGGYPSFSRMDIVKTELARTIEGLEPYVQFNVLSFATDVKSWKKRLVPANVLNKRSAVDWAMRLVPIGGESKEELARAGLVGSANLEAGKTNTYGALMEALGATGRGTVDSAYGVSVDTVFFLSDGRPTYGEYIDANDIMREVARVNELRKVVIHTIALGDFQKDFMRRLALANGGVYIDLGR